MARILRDDHTGRMTDWVLSIGVADAGAGPDLSRVDREQLPWMIDHLREAEADVRRLRKRLEAELGGTDRSCPVCGDAVTGRADQVYCGPTCRQRARRAADSLRTEEA